MTEEAVPLGPEALDEPVADEGTIEALEHAAGATLKGILLGSGPRFARDAFGPVLAFYIGWRLVGLLAGMVLAVIVSVSAYLYERRRERPGFMARISLGIIAIQVVIGLVSKDAAGFLAPPVLINGIYGLVFLISVPLRRPLAGLFAGEMYPFPPDVRASETFRHTFSRISLVWGTYLVIRAAVRFWVLTHASV